MKYRNRKPRPLSRHPKKEETKRTIGLTKTKLLVSGTVNGILYDNDEILIPVLLDEALPPYTEQKNNILIEFAGFLRDTTGSYKKESI